MGKTLKCMMLSLLLIVVASSVALSQSDNHFIGSWKLDVEKSDYGTAQGPRSATYTYEDRGDGVMHWTNEQIGTTGDRTFMQFAAKYDGRDYPFPQLGAKVPQTISIKLIDANRDEAVIKADGKVTTTVSSSISEDGKTLTHTVKGTDDQGQTFTYVEVFERQ